MDSLLVCKIIYGEKHLRWVKDIKSGLLYANKSSAAVWEATKQVAHIFGSDIKSSQQLQIDSKTNMEGDQGFSLNRSDGGYSCSWVDCEQTTDVLLSASWHDAEIWHHLVSKSCEIVTSIARSGREDRIINCSHDLTLIRASASVLTRVARLCSLGSPKQWRGWSVFRMQK